MNPEHLAVLMKTEWQLSYVTPLYQFSHTQLKSYSRELAAFIVAEKQQGLAVEVDVSCNNYRVSFSVVQGMAETDDDAETILIQVTILFHKLLYIQCYLTKNVIRFLSNFYYNQIRKRKSYTCLFIVGN